MGHRKYAPMVVGHHAAARGFARLFRKAKAAWFTKPKRKKKGKSRYYAKSGSKRRRTGTHTATLQRKMTDESGQHNKLVEDRTSIVIPGRQAHGPKGTHCIIKQNLSGIIKCGAGQQKNQFIGALCTKNQFIANAVTSGAVGADSLPINIFDINPYQFIAGSMATTGLVKPKFDKAYLDDVTGTLSMINLGNTAAHVKVWFIMNKTSNQNAVDAEWQAMMNDVQSDNTTFGSVVQASYTYNVAGNVTISNGTPGIPGTNIIGQVPTSLPAFRKGYSVLKLHKVVLEPGETNDINFKVLYKKYFEREYINRLGTNLMPNRTVQVMVTTHGSLMKLTDTTLTDGYCTHSPVELGYVWNQAYRVKPVLVENKVPYVVSSGNELAASFATAIAGGGTGAGTFTKIINDVDAVVNIASSYV